MIGPLPEVSVIVPVYNVENYLARCLDSICQQTERNIEIIIVNDATTDDSQNIIDQYAEKDQRIVSVVHGQNQGLGAARNTGIEKAQAPWLMFVDSDDYIPSDAIAVFLQKTKEYPAVKLFAAGTTRVIEGGESWGFDRLPLQETMLDNPFYNYCFQRDSTVEIPALSHTAWAKLFCRDIFSDLRFSPKTIMEDFALGLPLFDKLKGPVLLLPVRLYFYVAREGSMMHTRDKQKIKEFAQVLQNLSSYAAQLTGPKKDWAMSRIYWEFKLWMQHLCQAYSPDFPSYLLMQAPEHCAAKFFRDIQVLRSERQVLQQDRWYRFGCLSRKRKLWAIGKYLSKKLRVYRLLRPMAKLIQNLISHNN